MSKTGAFVLERAKKLAARLEAGEFEQHEWRALADDLRGCPLSDDCRAAWEVVVTALPSNASLWVRYAEAELAASNATAVREIFNRSLMVCKSVDLWFVYIRFIKKVNESRGGEGVLEVRAAYDFTLDHIGQDIQAGPLWLDYLSYLSAPKPGTQAYVALWTTGMVGGQEEGTRAAALRRVYQRAIAVPTHSLELLWKQYETFENTQSSKQLAPRILAEQRPRFQAARMAYRERKRKLEGIDMAAWAVAPGKGPQQEPQLRLWRAYLDSERSNPQRLDREALVARVSLAYDQALMVLRHFPELWYDYSRWHSESGGGPDAAVEVLARGAAALPDCLMVHFALADSHEAMGKVEEAKQVYEALVSQLEAAPAAASEGGAADQQQQQQSEGGAAGAPRGGPLAALPQDQQALAWIQYMRFLRRSDVAGSRRLFIRARKTQHCPWQVYAAAAGMEWRLSREKEVARKIFEKGLDSGCLTEPQYILQYVNFLADIGDANNARALFERALTEESNRRSAALWERYLALEFESADLQTALRLEKRARDALGLEGGGGGGGGGDKGGGGAGAKGLQLQLLLLRYEFLDVLPCAPDQKQYLLHLLGKGPPPPGFDRSAKRAAGSHAAGGPAGPGGGGGGADGGPPAGPGGAPGAGPGPGPAHPPRPSGTPIGGLFSGVLPWVVEDFLNRLPPPQLLDGPMPEVSVLVDAFLNTDFDAPAVRQALLHLEPAPGGGGAPGGGPRGVKRELDEEDGGGGAARDMYRMRIKQRARAGPGADG